MNGTTTKSNFSDGNFENIVTLGENIGEKYIRVKAIYPNQVEVTYNINKLEWMFIENGYYYYDNVCRAGEQIAIMNTNFSINSNLFTNDKFNFILIYEMVDVRGDENGVLDANWFEDRGGDEGGGD